MRKKTGIQSLYIIVLSIFLFACGEQLADEDQIEEDLSGYEDFSENEVIQEVEISRRQTDEDAGYDRVYATIITEDTEIEYEKSFVLRYQLYSEGGWHLEDVERDESGAWNATPIAGVSEESIENTLIGREIETDGDYWQINEESLSGVEINSHETDLENMTDEVEATITFENDLISGSSVVNLTYNFEERWQLDEFSSDSGVDVQFKDGHEPDLTAESLVNDLQAYQDNQYYSNSDNQFSDISNVEVVNTSISNYGRTYSAEIEFTVEGEQGSLNGNGVVDYTHDGSWVLNHQVLGYEITAEDIEGTWVGEYEDWSQPVSLELEISNFDESNHSFDAIFHFSAHPDNSDVPSGSFEMDGVIDASTLAVSLSAGDWIERPDNYLTINLQGRYDPATQTMYDDTGRSRNFEISK